MIFEELSIPKVFLISPEKMEDERGFFCRTFCRNEVLKRGLNPSMDQCSLSYNKKRGTIRGMHYQADPHAEAKIVQCVKGSIYDVVLDLRPSSKTFKRWLAIKLDSTSHQSLYIPEGVAHGFQTLEDETEIYYQISAPYIKESSRGVRWDDPTFGIDWPLPVEMISKRDREFELI